MGLTGREAKVYIALIRSTSLNIKEISNFSKVKRPDLYRVLKNLEQKGLVEREITYPIRYTAIPLHEGLDLLQQQKDEVYIELKRKVSALRNSAKKLHKQTYPATDESNYLLVPKSRMITRLEQAIDKSEKSISVILSEPLFLKGILRFSDNIEKSCHRGVEWFFILEKPSVESTIKTIKSFKSKTPNCQIRFLKAAPKTVTAICDQKEVFIFKNQTGNLTGASALWSNNENLVFLINDYFEVLWCGSPLWKMKDPISGRII